MAASVSRDFSTTVDEIAHLTAGYAYSTTADFRLQPENGNFPQRWCALPLLFQKVNFPTSTGTTWEQADVWHIGHQFFYESGNDLPAMLAKGRTMNALLSGLLCLSIFLLARDLFSVSGGLIALTLATFSPTLLAHGGLITSDTAAGLGFALAILTWSRLLQLITISRVLLAGAAFGLLALSKYSAVLLAPVVLATAGLRALEAAALPLHFRSRMWRLQGGRKAIALVFVSAAAILTALILIWAAYDFRYAASPRGEAASLDFFQSWDSVLLKDPPKPPMPMADGHSLQPLDRTPGLLQAAVDWATHHHVLPEAYLYGFAFVAKHSQGRLAYFAGDYRLTGWTDFFPTAFLVKTTLPALALITLGFLGLALVPVQNRREWLYRAFPLLALFVVYWTFAIFSHINIGHRHLLPVYVASYSLAGGSILFLARSYRWMVPIVALLLWHATESLTIRPDYLAYFNALCGGPTKAHWLFVDSSLDWGQDLPRLRGWINTHAGNDRVFLSYFGSGDPAREGIRATRLGDGYFDWNPRATPPLLTGGVYCISATMLHRVYTHVRGPWSPEYETRYQELTAWLESMPMKSGDPPLPAAEINARLFTYEQLQFGRLCHFLERRLPDACAGYSILIFRLSDLEVEQILHAPLSILDRNIAVQRG